MRMIELIQQDIKIIKIDENWLESNVLHKRKWNVNGNTNSLSNTIFNPLIILITALYND